MENRAIELGRHLKAVLCVSYLLLGKKNTHIIYSDKDYWDDLFAKDRWFLNHGQFEMLPEQNSIHTSQSSSNERVCVHKVFL